MFSACNSQNTLHFIGVFTVCLHYNANTNANANTNTNTNANANANTNTNANAGFTPRRALGRPEIPGYGYKQALRV